MSNSSHEDEAFERIRSEISRDIRPIRPIATDRVRALFLVPYALLALALLILVLGLRSDARDLGPVILWGLAVIQLLIAYLIFIFALRHATPGNDVSPKVWLGLLLLAVVMQVGVAFWTYQYSPLDVPSDHVLAYGLACFSLLSLFGIVPLAVTFWLLSRGLPLRPRIAGLITGFGSGLAAEAVYRAHCSYSHLSHVLPWHGGAVLLLGLVGFFGGVLWERRRLRQYEQTHRP